MAVINLQKALRSLQKTPTLLSLALQGITEQEAQNATDGAEGWSVLFILCHLRDFEAIFLERVRLTVETHEPQLLLVRSNEELTVFNDYANQTIADVRAELSTLREKTITYLTPLTEEQLKRVGIHPLMGASTALEFIVNIALHDIDHIEQIVRARHHYEGRSHAPI
jgi:uncharacterized damage-inducible protein DinB